MLDFSFLGFQRSAFCRQLLNLPTMLDFSPAQLLSSSTSQPSLFSFRVSSRGSAKADPLFRLNSSTFRLICNDNGAAR